MATQIEIAEHLDLSERRVRELVKCGAIPASTGTGGYSLADCRLSYIRYLRGLAGGQVRPEPPPSGGAVLDQEQERARLLKEQADAMGMKNAITRKEWAPIQAIEWAAAKAAAQVSAVLEGIPAIIRRRFPSVPVGVIDAIDREIVKCQSIASRVAVNFDEYMDSGEGGDSDRDDQGMGES